MNDFKIVLLFYLKKHLKSKVFWGITIFLSIFSIASMIFLNNFFKEDKKETIYVINKVPELESIFNNDVLNEDYFESLIINLSLLNTEDSKEKLKSKTQEENISIVLFEKENEKIVMEVIDNDKLSLGNITLIQNIVKQEFQLKKISELEINKEILSEINVDIEIRTANLEKDLSVLGIPFILFLLMVIFVIMYSNSSSNDVAYLKTNRVMEVFITSVKPIPLYLGVNIASSLIPFIQLLLTIISVWSVKVILKIDFSTISNKIGINLNVLDIKTLSIYIVLLLLGFFLYSFINTAMVSIVSKIEDINSIAVPIAFIGLVQYFIGIIALNNDSLVLKICSYFPLTSASIMFLRYSFGYAELINVLISIIILIITVSILAVLGSNIFARGISYYGNLKEFLFFNSKSNKYEKNS